MGVLNITQQKLGAGIDESGAHMEKVEALKRLIVEPLQRFKHFNDSTSTEGCSGRGLVLLLTNERKLFAFDDGAIDRYLGDIFPARHIVHDVEHNPLEH